MKYILVCMLAVAFQLNINAQKITEASVPDVVKTNFQTMFNSATVTQWEMENGNYQAHYTTHGADNSVFYTPTGEFIRYENTITPNEIPADARKYITTNLAGKKTGTMVRIKIATGDVTYKVQAGDENYFFDGMGRFLKSEKK